MLGEKMAKKKDFKQEKRERGLYNFSKYQQDVKLLKSNKLTKAKAEEIIQSIIKETVGMTPTEYTNLFHQIEEDKKIDP